MKFYRGPWIWNTAEKSWNPPEGFVGIDLRNATEQSTQGGTPGIGLFFGKGDLASEYDLLGSGSHRDVKTSARLRNLVPCRKGYTPKGNDLLGLIWDTLTDGADPDGNDFAKPIMPGTDGRLSLHCGQSHHERFAWGNANIKAVYRKDFARLFKDANEGKLKDRFQHLRVLDFWCEQFGLSGADDWKELVPNALQKDVPGRMRHETTITDDFNRSNSSASLGTSAGGWSWGNIVFSWDVNTNRAITTLAGAKCRANTDLSSADHYAQGLFGSGADARAGGCAVQQAVVAAPVYAAPIVAQVIAQPIYQQVIAQPVIAQTVYAQAYSQAVVQQSYGFSQSVVAPVRQRVVVQRVRAPVVTRTRTVQRIVQR